MNHSTYVNWGGHPIKLTWIPSKSLPNLEKVTSVHGYCFHEGKLLLVLIKDRGYNVPGGHIEPGESPEATLLREAHEEGYVKGNSSFIGMLEVSHEENPHFDPLGKYPLIGYQLFYRMDIDEVLPFQREYESIARIWVEPDQLPYVIDDHELSALILKEAMLVRLP
ncbi:NUDIX hydrolase [Falsibacillus albus]|uniref:NUDIX domain-containing protein n=1 Tax=Falsibacillus albus TaxID=2478915 RepID=A0A3L7JQW7_9BACI|nr:NUDIX domain-containing protein [Falsibacillus albus]RLQ93203.1 NUDIX domain-containing protein [Falsibacillus albus]